MNDAKNNGTGGNIIISTDELLMQNQGGLIGNRTFTEAAGGNIFIDSNDIKILGSSTVYLGVQSVRRHQELVMQEIFPALRND